MSTDLTDYPPEAYDRLLAAIRDLPDPETPIYNQMVEEERDAVEDYMAAPDLARPSWRARVRRAIGGAR